jgi:hypothetical protein
MLDRLDDALEPVARLLTGKAQWDEMKENALLASSSNSGGARIAATHVANLVASNPKIELHVPGHSAGSIFHAGLIKLLTDKPPQGHGLSISTCTLWAPACTVDLFKDNYLPAMNARSLKRLFALPGSRKRPVFSAQFGNRN